MTINFTDLKVKQAPASNQGLTVSLVENDPNLPTPVEQESATIDTTKLNPAQLKTVNEFIALLKSKL